MLNNHRIAAHLDRFLPVWSARALLGLFLLALVLAAGTGCTRFRFVVDAVPAVDALTETEVMDDRPGRLSSSPKIALIEVYGTLADARPVSPLMAAENPVSRFVEALRRAREDRNVKAIIVRINSRGGTVTASDVMYRELQHFKADSEKPIIILMADIAASGGYYLACAGDEIIAHPTTITGSVGVIMQTFNVSRGLQMIGIEADAITSGSNKAIANPFEPMPPAHREMLQTIVNEFHDGFVAVVKENRPNLTDAALPAIRDGRVVTGKQAAELGLVDQLGDLHDAFALAKTRAGLTAARLVKYHRPLEHVGSAYAHSDAPVTTAEVTFMQVNLSAVPGVTDVGFYYVWDPTAW